MKILYTPEILNGEQAQGDTLNKYGVEFEKGKATEVTDEGLIKKMLTCPYFSEVKEVPRGTVKKAGRPRKADGNKSADSNKSSTETNGIRTRRDH